ncbi:multicopper oxidase [Bacillus thermotolerans]|uniref:multicopper oxidase n=1 Tax=Bacillus thermotolerans TaxID=1221996 RepID=UPI000583C86E|nr:Multicopper oxidase [Bacillus thermotolerans]
MSNHVNPSDPNTIPKFVNALKKPPVAKPTPHCDYPKGSYYELEMKEGKHRFHKDFPKTRIWGYNGISPGPTIEAMKHRTTHVKYLNKLPREHFLPIDRTLHSSIDTPDVRTVVHLHGAHVDWESDGFPEAWYTRDYEMTGPYFRREVHSYTNHQPGATLWYHDHAMSMTRLNVYSGLAGFYLLRDPLEERLNLPSGKYEIPLMIQDRSFNEDGSLFYPYAPGFEVSVNPSITPGVLGETIVVNGKVWPYLRVEPRKYRFRILNASNRRGYVLALDNGQTMFQIGTDGGFLSEPAEISSVEMLPAERGDFIIDFTGREGQQITLVNNDTEFPGEHTSVVMQFRVDLPLEGTDESQIPETLYPEMEMHEDHAHLVRDLPLTASTDQYGRPMLMLNDRMYHDPASETPVRDSIEIWNLINTTPIPHPIHVHLVQFKILERRPFNVDRYVNEGVLEWTGPAEEPRDYERGPKDVVKADVGMVTKIMMHFKEFVGNYIWHCHFLEHEDHDMMRPLRIIENTQPVQLPHADEAIPVEEPAEAVVEGTDDTGADTATETTEGTDDTAAEAVTEGTEGTDDTAAEAVTEGTEGTDDTGAEVVTEGTEGTDDTGEEAAAEGTEGTDDTVAEAVTEVTEGTDDTGGEVAAEGTEGTDDTGADTATEATEGTDDTGTEAITEDTEASGAPQENDTEEEQKEMKGSKKGQTKLLLALLLVSEGTDDTEGEATAAIVEGTDDTGGEVAAEVVTEETDDAGTEAAEVVAEETDDTAAQGQGTSQEHDVKKEYKGMHGAKKGKMKFSHHKFVHDPEKYSDAYEKLKADYIRPYKAKKDDTEPPAGDSSNS